MKTFFKKIGFHFYLQIIFIVFLAMGTFKIPKFYIGLALGVLVSGLISNLVTYHFTKDE